MDKTLFLLLRALALAWLCVGAFAARAQAPDADAWIAEAQRFATAELTAQLAAQGATAGSPRTEVRVGRLDPRLRLNACERVVAYLPRGLRLWGQTRVGLRCVKGVTPWNVYLPLTVNVYGPALVSTSSLPAGHVLAASDFRQAEVNLAEDRLHLPITDATLLLGRSLARPLEAGQPVREASLKARQWFTAGDKVRIRVAGSGFAVASGGEAVTAGLEGQPARVRTESGRVVSGMPVAERLLEIAL